MTSESTQKSGVAEIAGDACMLSAVAVPLGPLAVVVGPAAAWLLHGRRMDKRAVGGWALGLLAGIVAVGALVALLAFGLNAVGQGGEDQNTVPIVVLGVVALAFLGAVIWLDVDAIRDLMASQRDHARVDVVRLVVSGILLVAIIAVTVVQTRYPASEAGEAGVFALASGAVGAIAAAVASAWQLRTEAADD